MGWSDADLDSITIPSDASDTDTRIFIGTGDPTAEAAGVDAAVVFYGGIGGTMMSPAPTNQAFVMGVFPQPDPDSAGWTLKSRHLTSNAEQGILQAIVSGDSTEAIRIGNPNPSSQTIDIGAAGAHVTAGGYPLGGVMGLGSLVSASPNVSTETDLISLSPPTGGGTTLWKANTAYAVEIDGWYSVPASSNLTVGFSLWKGGVIGTKLTEYGRFPAPSNNVFYSCHKVRRFQVGGSDVSAVLTLTIYPQNTFQAAAQAIASTPFTVVATELGPSSYYTALNLPTLT